MILYSSASMAGNYSEARRDLDITLTEVFVSSAFTFIDVGFILLECFTTLEAISKNPGIKRIMDYST